MTESLLALIVDEGKWLTFSMTIAVVAAGALWYRADAESVPSTVRILAAMNLMGGLIVGTMAFGHLLAVSVKLAQGTLRDGSLLAFIAIGASLLIPAVLVVRHTSEVLSSNPDHARRTVSSSSAGSNDGRRSGDWCWHGTPPNRPHATALLDFT